MPVDYTVELDYREEEDPLGVGDLVEFPVVFPEFPRGGVARIVDRDEPVPITSTLLSEALWILDPRDRPGDPDGDDETYLQWPVDRGGELRRVADDPTVPTAADVERWVVDGMRRDGLTPAAYVNVSRQ